MEFDVDKALKYFLDVLKSHFADFGGRVSRKDFWTYIAVYAVIAVAVYVVQNIIGVNLLSLLQIALLLPNAGMMARRLQDTGQPGTLVWLLAIPILIGNLVEFMASLTFGALGLVLALMPIMGLLFLVILAAAVYMIYLCAQPGTPGSNPFGPEPASAT